MLRIVSLHVLKAPGTDFITRTHWGKTKDRINFCLPRSDNIIGKNIQTWSNQESRSLIFAIVFWKNENRALKTSSRVRLVRTAELQEDFPEEGYKSDWGKE